MEIEPINGHILVKPSPARDKTAGGIYLPDNAKEKLQEGEVISLAEDATDEVAVGDTVVFREYGGTEVDADGKPLRLLTEDDLLVKYTRADAIPE